MGDKSMNLKMRYLDIIMNRLDGIGESKPYMTQLVFGPFAGEKNVSSCLFYEKSWNRSSFWTDTFFCSEEYLSTYRFNLPDCKLKGVYHHFTFQEILKKLITNPLTTNEQFEGLADAVMPKDMEKRDVMVDLLIKQFNLLWITHCKDKQIKLTLQ